MKIILKLMGCLLLASFFVSCNEENAQQNEVIADPIPEQNEDWEAEMYEASELVVLMRQIHDEQLAVKAEILEGKSPGAMPDYYVEMHTASSTDPSEIDEVYHSLADKFIAEYEIMSKADNETRTDKFNTVISTCVACHNNYCQGPIPKIEKLYIEK